MNKEPVGNRRRFLFGASAASVAAAATVLTTGAPNALRAPATKAKVETGRGYQLSEHVRNYYRTTAV